MEPSKEPKKQDRVNPKDPGASLVEALQSLVLDMSKASKDSEVEEGLKRLKEIRGIHLGAGATDAQSARKQAEALIAWVEQRLEQLRQQLARKRRRQEGEAMEKIAKEREAAAPSLLPTELIDAIVHSTESKDPEEATSSVTQREPAPLPPEKKQPVGSKPVEKKTGRKEEQKEKAEEEKKPAEPGKPVDWTRFELLAAHMAASVRANDKFFEKLRRTYKRKGPKLAAPEDNDAAQNYYRTVHDLNKRLVNMEMNARALAAADEKKDKLSPLLRTAAREIKLFQKELRAGKETMPAMAPELDRLFGGWAEGFARMKPELGADLLAKCAAERQLQPKREAMAAKAPEPEPPQLVLRRDEWEQ